MIFKKNKEVPGDFFKIDAKFIRKFNKILIDNFVIEKFRGKILKEFMKLVKKSIVKK